MVIDQELTLLKRVRELEDENQQFRFALGYVLFDLEATRRERDEAKEEVRILRGGENESI